MNCIFMYRKDSPYEKFSNISRISLLPSSFTPCAQLQELIHSAEQVLPHCSKKQVEDLKAKQQAIVTNWKALKSKVEQRRRLLEQAYKLYEFQAHVSTSAICPSRLREGCLSVCESEVHFQAGKGCKCSLCYQSST